MTPPAKSVLPCSRVNWFLNKAPERSSKGVTRRVVWVSHHLSGCPSHRCPLVGHRVASLPLWAGTLALTADHLCCLENLGNKNRERNELQSIIPLWCHRLEMKRTLNARQIQTERLQNGKLCNELSIDSLLFDVVWCIQAENVAQHNLIIIVQVCVCGLVKHSSYFVPGTRSDVYVSPVTLVTRIASPNEWDNGAENTLSSLLTQNWAVIAGGIKWNWGSWAG